MADVTKWQCKNTQPNCRCVTNHTVHGFAFQQCKKLSAQNHVVVENDLKQRMEQLLEHKTLVNETLVKKSGKQDSGQRDSAQEDFGQRNSGQEEWKTRL